MSFNTLIYVRFIREYGVIYFKLLFLRCFCCWRLDWRLWFSYLIFILLQEYRRGDVWRIEIIRRRDLE